MVLYQRTFSTEDTVSAINSTKLVLINEMGKPNMLRRENHINTSDQPAGSSSQFEVAQIQHAGCSTCFVVFQRDLRSNFGESFTQSQEYLSFINLIFTKAVNVLSRCPKNNPNLNENLSDLIASAFNSAEVGRGGDGLASGQEIQHVVKP